MTGLLRQLWRRAAAGRADWRAPVVIGATGGSGTRVLQDMLARAGLFMGAELNHAGDAMLFEPALDRWINPVIAATGSLDYRPANLPAAIAGKAGADLAAALAAHRRQAPAGTVLWGWKNPRSMYLLPLIHDLCPGLRFVHLVRDGRDMALSGNQNQLRKHFQALFARLPAGPGDSIRLWARANAGTADWGARMLGARYRLLRFEDLCAAPEASVTDLLRWAGAAPAAAAEAGRQAAEAVRPPCSLRRWQALPDEARRELEEAGAPALRRFGYLD